MYRLRTLIFVVFIFLLTGTQVFGASREVFVDSSAGGGGNGSIGSPFNELSDIGRTQWSQISTWIGNGDTVYIYLKGGSTFTPGATWTWGASGASGRPITITRYSTGNDPIINGGNSVATGIEIDGYSYITFDNIKFDDNVDRNFWIHGGATNISFTNCYFTHTSSLSYQQHGLELDVSDGNLSTFLFQYCTFYRLDDGIRIEYVGNISTDMDNITVDHCTFSMLTNGIHNYVNSDTAYNYQISAGARTSNITFTNNYFHDLYNDAIIMNCKGGTNLISGNALINIGTGGQKTNALQLGHCEDLIVEKNYIDTVNAKSGGDSHGIILDHYKQGQTSHDCNGVIVRFNYITNCVDQSGSRAIKVWDAKNSEIYGNVMVDNIGAIGASKAGNTGNVFFNNTMVQSEGSCVFLDGGNYDLTETTTWKNNICVGGDYFFKKSNSGRVIEDHNLYYQTRFSDALSPNASNINTNPQFGGINSGDYRLSASSPALRSGTELASSKYAYGLSPSTQWSKIPPEVIVGKRGISQNGWEVGAYVFSDEAIVETIAPPRNLSIQ